MPPSLLEEEQINNVRRAQDFLNITAVPKADHLHATVPLNTSNTKYTLISIHMLSRNCVSNTAEDIYSFLISALGGIANQHQGQ